MEKMKHVALGGIVAVSLAVFGAAYYSHLGNVSGKSVASRVLADDNKDSGGETKDSEDEQKSEDDNKDKDKAAEVKKEEEKSAKEAVKEEQKKITETKTEENKNNSSSNSSSRKSVSSEKNRKTETIDAKNEDDENEIENEDDNNDEKNNDNEDGGNGSTVSKEVVSNEDGTTTQRMTITQKDGSKKIFESTFDSGNKLVSKKKSEIKNENGEEKTEVKTFDVYGEKISEYKMETKDGKKIEIERKGAGEESKLKFDSEKNELMVRVKDGEEDDARAFLRVKADDSSAEIKLTRAGITANSNFPITVDDVTGKVYVKTPKKEVELKQMPDVIVEKAKQADGLDIVKESTLEGDDNPEYAIKGIRFEKLLGIFPVEIPVEVSYNADTGQKVSVDISGFKKVLSWFSF